MDRAYSKISEGDQKIIDKWNTLAQPGAFSSASYLARALHENKKTTTQALKKSLLFQSHRDLRKNFSRLSYDASYFGELFQADLADFSGKISSALTGQRKGTFVLVVVDVFTRMVFARGLKSKRGAEVAEAFKNIFDNIDLVDFQGPAVCQVDRGKEFFNATVKNLFEKRNIILKAATNISKSAIAERQVKVIKKLVMTAVQTGEWPDGANFDAVVQMACKNSNGRYNRGIKMTPMQAFSDAKASSQRREQVWQSANFVSPATFVREQKDLVEGKGIEERGITWKIGQLVLPPVKKSGSSAIGEKDYKRKFDLRFATINEIFHSRRPLLFRLIKSDTKRPFPRLFYSVELKEANVPPTINASDVTDVRVTKNRKLEYKTKTDERWHSAL